LKTAWRKDDWDGFKQLTMKLGDHIQMVGDDIYVTNPKFIRRGIAEGTERMLC